MNKAMPKSHAKTAYGLLSEVRRLILAEPRRYSQRRWLERVGGFGGADELFVEPGAVVPACGTVGCVAGWVAALKQTRVMSDRASVVAQRVLGLTQGQAEELFDEDAAGYTITQTLEHAQVGAAHIAAFQKKYAKQLKAKAVGGAK